MSMIGANLGVDGEPERPAVAGKQLVGHAIEPYDLLKEAR
jgi:hypothetical protein